MGLGSLGEQKVEKAADSAKRHLERLRAGFADDVHMAGDTGT